MMTTYKLFKICSQTALCFGQGGKERNGPSSKDDGNVSTGQSGGAATIKYNYSGAERPLQTWSSLLQKQLQG